MLEKPYVLPQSWANAVDSMDPTIPEYQDIIEEPPQSKIESGWVFGEKPSHKYFNWNWKTIDDYLHHVNSYGIPLWDPETLYEEGSIVLYNPYLYKALAQNQNTPPTDDTVWQRISKKFEELQDVGTQPTDSSKYVVMYNGTEWSFENTQTVIENSKLDKLRGVNISTSNVDDVFVYAGEWKSLTPSEALKADPNSSITDLKDINEYGLDEGDVIKYDGVAWRTGKNIVDTVTWDKVLNKPNEYQPPVSDAMTLGGAIMYSVGNTLYIYARTKDAPSSPRNLKAISNPTKIELLWNPPIADGGTVLFYNVYRDGTKYVKGVLDAIFDDDNVEEDKEYEYYITAENKYGESNGSNKVIGHTFRQPSEPKNLQVQVDTELKTVTLTWDTPDVVSGNITYTIYRNDAPIGQSVSTFYKDENLQSGVYTYYVTAQNKYFESNRSVTQTISI
jgi:hypothetical protein